MPETPEVAVEEREMGTPSVPDGMAVVAEEEGALGDGLEEEEGRCSLRGLLRRASTSRKASSTGFSGPKLRRQEWQKRQCVTCAERPSGETYAVLWVISELSSSSISSLSSEFCGGIFSTSFPLLLFVAEEVDEDSFARRERGDGVCLGKTLDVGVVMPVIPAERVFDEVPEDIELGLELGWSPAVKPRRGDVDNTVGGTLFGGSLGRPSLTLEVFLSLTFILVPEPSSTCDSLCFFFFFSPPFSPEASFEDLAPSFSSPSDRRRLTLLSLSFSRGILTVD